FVSWPTPPRRLKPKRPCLRRSEHVSSFTSLWTEVYLPLDDSPVKRVGSPTRTPPECGFSKGRSGGVSGTLRCGRYEGYYEGSIQKTPGRARGSSRNLWHEQSIGRSWKCSGGGGGGGKRRRAANPRATRAAPL